MLSEDVKSRLSIAFASTKDNIFICRNIVTGLSIPSTEKTSILGDLADVENIMKQQKFGDINAIQEAIVAIGNNFPHHIYTRNLPGVEHLKESLGFILQWLEYIKKTLGYEGLVPSTSMKDIRSESHSKQSTSQSNYGYFDDSGNFVEVEGISPNHF